MQLCLAKELKALLEGFLETVHSNWLVSGILTFLRAHQYQIPGLDLPKTKVAIAFVQGNESALCCVSGLSSESAATLLDLSLTIWPCWRHRWEQEPEHTLDSRRRSQGCTGFRKQSCCSSPGARKPHALPPKARWALALCKGSARAESRVSFISECPATEKCRA